MKEKFSIPGVGGIIVKYVNGVEHILIQDRSKEDAIIENGLLEIPAGKIREFENIYNCLRREIEEETGYVVEEINGEKESKVVEINNYTVLTYEPFSSSQNLDGYYPIMVQVFVCKVKDDNKTHKESNESKNIRWIRKADLKNMLRDKTKFYPMHIISLEKYCSI